ncbi:HlyD family type I secretion periplasmic adaptor subunit [Thermodesulfobacteriota bacterium]
MTEQKKDDIQPVNDAPESPAHNEESLGSQSGHDLVTPGETKKSTYIFFLLLAVLCLSFTVWSFFSKLDVVSVAEGEVIPSSKLKSVQHLEGGIVRSILVKEGQIVEKGQHLVELQTTASDADVREIELRVVALRIEIARLEAETAGKKQIEFDQDLIENQSRLIQQVNNLFIARRESLQNDLKRQRELINQRRQQMNEITARLRNQKKRLVLLEEQIKISNDLLEDELTNRYEHLDLLKEQNSLKSSIEENGAILSSAEAAIKEEELRLTSINSSFEEEVQTSLDDSRRQLRELTERKRKFEDNLKRTVLRSPVDGVVKKLYIFTEGGVVRPGGTLLDIVPRDDVLVIEAKLHTEDIGYIHVGQKAVIRLSTDTRRFGKLDGEVIRISPDTLISEKGSPYYQVRIATEKDYFEKGDHKYKLYPGMILTVNILTGQRTVFEYIVSPWVEGMDSAMTER